MNVSTTELNRERAVPTDGRAGGQEAVHGLTGPLFKQEHPSGGYDSRAAAGEQFGDAP